MAVSFRVQKKDRSICPLTLNVSHQFFNELFRQAKEARQSTKKQGCTALDGKGG